MKSMYPEIPSSPDFPAMEQEVLAGWQAHGTFEQSVQQRSPVTPSGENNEYVFYDGPPFANGLPHHGHLLTGFVKDLFARYHTMKGQRVERRFGWDCHGLPAEMEAEKGLKISGRRNIMDYGINNFNEYCRTSVMKYAGQWRDYVSRQARWVDFDNDYKTMDTPYMESVLWAFSRLHKKGYIYEGFKVMPYSWSAETVLSSSEIRLDDATREKEDKAVTVAFKLKDVPEGAPEADNYYLLAWTTTPWTLPSNLALAVSEQMEYVAVLKDNSPLVGESNHVSDSVGGDSQTPPPIPLPQGEGREAVQRGYPKEHTKLAKALRKNPTEAEKLLWSKLKGEQLGVKIRRQQPIGSYIVDFYNAEKRVVIEVDGGQHADNPQDDERTAWLEAQGLKLLRFWNNEVLENIDGVLLAIQEQLDNTPHQIASGDLAPPQGGSGKDCYILARSALPQYSKELGIIEEDLLPDGRLDEVSGKSLTGLSYEPLFPYFADTPNAFRILDGSDFIEEGSGTGVVHMAPGFGEDDQRVCADHGIDPVVPVDGEGRYTDAIYDLPRVSFREDAAAEGSGDLSDMTIETARCILRPFTPEDEGLLMSLHTNPKVMETMNDGVMSEQEVKDDFVAILDHQAEYGYSQWAAFHKETGAFMGRAGISNIAQSKDKPQAPTLRCGLLPDFWHGGYGSELCHASLHAGFTQCGLERIVAGAHGDNPRAHAMLSRLGMTQEAQVMFKRVPGPYFAISKDAFFAANPPLSLKGLNVIKETKGQCEAEPYNGKQLEKYGLANLRIINWLKMKGQLIKQEDYKHNYPHCWRTDEPIIYKAMSSWFVDVPQFRDRMVELNQDINWIPNHIKDGRFGKWLENAREWSISRSRFWGCPIPVWRSDNPENDELYVFGSISELEEFFGEKVEDLHRPFIDDLTKPDSKDPNYTIRRVEEVFDCWFESGSMPYAQVHYPFENKEWFENHFPADFIVEYEAQTRGWFYNMMVLSVALFDRVPFKNCICHGVVLDDQGRKLSKRLKNYMDPNALFDQYGSDALRWFMMSSTIMRGSELLLDPDGKFIHDAIRLYIKPIWNAYHFFTLYANADGVKAAFNTQSDHVMDRYILAKCKQTVEAVEKALDAYDTPTATQAITECVEVLNNWYIRRNKDRFWNDRQDADKQAAYDTLYSVLHIVCRVAAPLLPMVAEKMYQGLTGEASVHLADWPELSAAADEAELVADMDRVRDACNAMLSIRNSENIRVRQPLESATLYGDGATRLRDYEGVIADEVNVKRIVFADSLEGVAEHKLTIHFPVAGKRLGKQMKAVGAAARSGDWALENGQMVVGGVALEEGEYVLQLQAKDSKGTQALSTNDALVVLDLNITPELASEGLARDLVRMIQQARKDAGLNVSDRIALHVEASEKLYGALQAHQDYISTQTLAVSLEQGGTERASHQSTQQLDGESVVIGLAVAA